MPRARLPGLRTLADLFAAGVQHFVNRLMNQGVYGSRLAERLRRAIPDAFASSLRALQQRVLNQRDLARRVNRGYRVTRADCRASVQVPNVIGPVVYSVDVAFADPDTGLPLIRQARVDMDFGSTLVDVKVAAVEIVKEQRARPKRGDSLPGGEMSDVLTDYEIRVTKVECTEF